MRKFVYPSTKRLARSLMRTRIRLIAVTLLVTVGVFGGVAFASYAHTASRCMMTYADTENGLNLPDIWIENPEEVE